MYSTTLIIYSYARVSEAFSWPILCSILYWHYYAVQNGNLSS